MMRDITLVDEFFKGEKIGHSVENIGRYTCGQSSWVTYLAANF